MKRTAKEITIRVGDPLVALPYNKYFLSDKIDYKRYATDMDICKLYGVKFKKGGVFP